MTVKTALPALLLLGVPGLLWGQDLSNMDRGWEAGVRYWRSSGETRWNHNAQPVAPTLGNPTSVLVYERLHADALELHGAKRWRQGWFIIGNVGFGSVRKGSLDDEDFNANQAKFSDTTSSIEGGDLAYLTVDGGREIWRSPGGSTLGIFGGLQSWVERVDAAGASGTVTIGNGVRVITNEVRWASLRAGIALQSRIGEKTRLIAQLALVPYTRMTNYDSHYLRGDLGPTPNITMEGSGNGIQLDAEVRHSIFPTLEASAGIRYWSLKADGTARFGGSPNLPLNEIESKRFGLTLGITKRW